MCSAALSAGANTTWTTLFYKTLVKRREWQQTFHRWSVFPRVRCFTCMMSSNSHKPGKSFLFECSFYRCRDWGFKKGNLLSIIPWAYELQLSPTGAKSTFAILNYFFIPNPWQLNLRVQPLSKMMLPYSYDLCVNAQSGQLFATPWTVAHQAPRSMGFPRQEYWNG